MPTDVQSTAFWAIILILVIREIVWKGIGLWKAARNKQKYWFIAMLIINSVRIIPIIYIFLFQKGKKGI
ncbi:hypothetical protein CUN85_00445 [Methanolobus halotolerans]|uniref:DUF5652 domain-containing protein n=2 Tax=Methanolobus halotolerans TaxID=2052935 RepID=A0A4E0PZ38_9EURY|nr:hypothetical protein CUN85_00445 [Methanolobus halotolerans]